MGIGAAIGDAIATVATFFGTDAAAIGAGAGLADAGLAAGTDLGIGAGFASDAAIAGGAGLGAGAAEGAGLGLGAGFASDAAIAGGAGLGADAAAGLGAGGLVADVGTAGLAADLGAGGLAAGGDFAGAGLGAGADVAGIGAGATPGLGATALGADAPVLGGAPAAIAGAPAVGSAPAAALPAFADPTSLAAAQGGSLFTGAVDSAPVAASGATSTGAIGADTGATFADSLTPATAGTTAGPVDAGTWDVATNSGGVGNWLTTQAGKIGDYIGEHPLQSAGTGLSALGLGRSLLASENPNPIPGMGQLSALASELGSTGTGLINSNAASARGVAGQATSQAATLENYLNTGTLPPAVQTALDQATKDGIVNIRAQYASRGMPPGSSAEQQEIASLNQRAVIQGGTLAAQLFSQGVSLDQLAASIYGNLTSTGGALATGGAGAQESLVNTGVQLNNGVNNAIANLSSALGGGGRTIVNGNTITLPQAA